jgi:REP element-mobilizing transposase RayT
LKLSAKEGEMPYTELRKGRVSEPGRIYFITTVTRGRTPIFSDLGNARLLIGVMRQLVNMGVVSSRAWVVMPDHLHWLIHLESPMTLTDVVRRLKGNSARCLNRRPGRAGPLWQKSFYDHALRREEDVRGVARYIIANPLRAGLVKRVEDYPHWDAVWL